MTPDAMRVALAEWAGFTPEREGWNGTAWQKWTSAEAMFAQAPALTLDWLHELEQRLTISQCYTYNACLGKMLGDWRPEDGAKNWPFHYSVEHRAEALLREVNLWREEV